MTPLLRNYFSRLQKYFYILPRGGAGCSFLYLSELQRAMQPGEHDRTTGCIM